MVKVSESITEADAPIVQMRHITKSFPGVRALDDVSMTIKKGEVHILLGENGAGKSTLMKILTGVYNADSGEILLNGKKVNVDNIHEAQKLRIGTVFQENSLIPHLTVAENIFLTREIKNKYNLIDWKKMYSESQKWANELGVEIEPHVQVKRLSVAQQQVVEIVKMFSQDPQIVILDEPTSALSDNEIENLFNIIRRMQSKGVTFIYISHRLEELKEIGNSATVLRDGKFIKHLDNIKEHTMDEIISYIVGRTLNDQYPKRNAVIGDVVLEVKNLTVPDTIKDINFSVHSGEVLGFSGLLGSGRTETAKAIFGDLKKSSGEIFINGKKVHISNPRDAIKNKIGLLPENRKEEGLVLKKRVDWNIVFSSLSKIKKGPFVDSKQEEKISKDYVASLGIKTPSLSQQVQYLSGGNQQKVVFAKWLCADSHIYIFDEPTRGIDVGAKREIYNIINELVEKRNAVIVISSELPEILGVCDRIAVFCEGRLMKIIDRKDATQENIMYYAMGGEG